MDKKSLVEKAIWENVKPSPINQVIVRNDWVQLTTPGAATPVMNGIFRCEIDSADAEKRVIETIASYRQQKLPFRWKTCDSTRPTNLDELLLKNGMFLKDKLYGLYGNPANLKLETNPEVSIKELSPELKNDWLQVQASAWNVPPAGISFIDKNFHKEFAAISEGWAKAYLAYYQGRPVASAGLLLHEDYGYLAGGATDPQFRNKGVYRCLLKKRLDVLRELQLPAIIHCIWNTSAPICLKLGFEKVAEIHSFEIEG